MHDSNRRGRLGLCLFFLVAELITGRLAVAAKITPRDLVLGYGHHLTVGDQPPLEISREQFFALGGLKGRGFPGLAPAEAAALDALNFYARSFVATRMHPERRMSLTPAERAWLERAQAGVLEDDEIGRQVRDRLWTELGAVVAMPAFPPPAAIITYLDRTISLTPTQVQIVDLARTDAESIARYDVVAASLGWTMAEVARSLKAYTQAIDAETLIQTGRPLFEHVRGVGYRLVERDPREVGRGARPRATPAGRMMVSARQAIALDRLKLRELNAHVVITHADIVEMGLPLRDLIEALNGLNEKAVSLVRRPLVEDVEVRFRKRVLRFVNEEGLLVGIGCAASL